MNTLKDIISDFKENFNFSNIKNNKSNSNMFLKGVFIEFLLGASFCCLYMIIMDIYFYYILHHLGNVTNHTYFVNLTSSIKIINYFVFGMIVAIVTIITVVIQFKYGYQATAKSNG